MAKMIESQASVLSFIETIEKESKKKDSLGLLKIFEEVTGYEPKIWGDRIIGFGKYQYKYASGHSGEAPYVGFAPGKSNHISLYIMMYGDEKLEKILDGLGKHKRSKGCVYINKLADVNEDVLKEAILYTMKDLKDKYQSYK